MALKKFLIIPQLIWYQIRAPRDQGKAWDHFWSRIRRTGASGDILWDTGDRRELEGAIERMGSRVDRSLPIVDVGCGNGRYTRALSFHFPRAIGIDISQHALNLARTESQGIGNTTFRLLNIGEPGTGRRLAQEIGEANVFMRGVLHVLPPGQRSIAAENLRELVGRRGAVYLSESNFEGDPLEQLVSQGATPTSMPDVLRRCIEAGIRPPSHFGERQVSEYFPAERWEVLDGGPIMMYTLPLTQKEIEALPSYFALVRARG